MGCPQAHWHFQMPRLCFPLPIRILGKDVPQSQWTAETQTGINCVLTLLTLVEGGRENHFSTCRKGCWATWHLT